MEHNASFFSFELTIISDNTNHFKQNLKFCNIYYANEGQTSSS